MKLKHMESSLIMKNIVRFIGILGIQLLLMASHSYGQQQSFELIADPVNGAAPDIKKHITAIEQHINHPKSWKGLQLSGDHPAIGLLNNLIDTEEITTARTTAQVRLLSHPDGTYEVRDIYVKTAHTDTLEQQQLVLQFDSKAQLIGVGLASKIHNYQWALDRKVVADARDEEAVIKQISVFQDALASSDRRTLSALLTRDAHIIKGDIARYYFKDQLGPYFQYSVVSPETFIDDLTDTPGLRKQVRYEDLQVYQYPQRKGVFVATFHQRWQAGAYADQGYVAMVVDLRDDPAVPVRVWQPISFETGWLQFKSQPLSRITIPQPEAPQILSADLQPRTVPHSKVDDDPGFLRSNKRWLLLSAGATAAISIGAAILGGGSKNGELPNPPGRPAMR